MINRDDIEAGDKCYTRDGGCLVAYASHEGIRLCGRKISTWERNGQFVCAGTQYPLDIIRIEKAPKPVVEKFTMFFALVNGDTAEVRHTFINGKLEKSEQVK